MDLWSVIVYGRTKEADYRFLAIPDDFEIEEQNWARKYIHGTTVYAEKLRGNPRWSLFKNHKHCIFGVTCMVRELIGSEPEYKYLAKDAAGRSLHIFVGYVIQISKKPYFNSLDILPDFENLKLFQFQSLLGDLEKLWDLKDYQLINRKIDKYPYKSKLNYSPENRRCYINNIIPPNSIPCSEAGKEEKNLAFVCPDDPEYREKLWKNCCTFFNYPHKDITLSLCLGLPQTKDVLEGPFLNATTSDITQPEKLPKSPFGKQKVLNGSLKITKTNNKEVYKITKNSSSSLADRDLLILILLIAIIVFLIFLFIWKPLIFAILISLLIGFWLGRMFEKNQNRSSKK